MAVIRRRRRPPRVEIVPMIDVMFILVVFFMLSTTFRTEPASIQVDLPKAATGAVQEQAELRITVTEQGAMFVNGVSTGADQLRNQVREAVSARPDTIVIVSADRRVAYDHVVRAMDLAREGGAFRLALSVDSAR